MKAKGMFSRITAVMITGSILFPSLPAAFAEEGTQANAPQRLFTGDQRIQAIKSAGRTSQELQDDKSDSMLVAAAGGMGSLNAGQTGRASLGIQTRALGDESPAIPDVQAAQVAQRNPLTVSNEDTCTEMNFKDLDPYESLNRFTFGMNIAAAKMVRKLEESVAGDQGSFTSSLPSWAQSVLGVFGKVKEWINEGLDKVWDNLYALARVLNCLLQGRWADAGHEAERFVVNSTVGVAGFFDPAESWLGIKETVATMNQTFLKYGWKNSAFVVPPGQRPMTVREETGRFIDWWLTPETYFMTAWWQYALEYALKAESTHGEPKFSYADLTPDMYEKVRCQQYRAQEKLLAQSNGQSE